MTTISHKSKAYRAAATRGDWHSVCLIGWDGPRPAAFGDNLGILPVRVATSTKELVAHERADLESPHVRVVVLEHVLVPSAKHAKDLKDALDEILLGHQEEHENAPLRSRWRNARGMWEQDDPDKDVQEHSRALFWAILLDEARRVLATRYRGDFPMFDSDQVYQMISKRAMRGN